MPNVGKPEILFEVLESNSPKILLVADFSVWAHIEVKPAVIEINIPGSSEAISFNFIKKATQSFNSNNLYIGCTECDGERVDLPDGIYKIRVKGSPDTFFQERYYLKTDLLRIELDKMYIDAGFNFEKSEKKILNLSKIELYLKAAKAHTRQGDLYQANRFFTQALNLTDCRNCH